MINLIVTTMKCLHGMDQRCEEDLRAMKYVKRHVKKSYGDISRVAGKRLDGINDMFHRHQHQTRTKKARYHETGIEGQVEGQLHQTLAMRRVFP